MNRTGRCRATSAKAVAAITKCTWSSQFEGPAQGEPWQLLPSEQTFPLTPTLDTRAHEHVQEAYVPKVGERIAARGRWIVDCGHPDFHAEIHPLTFAAFGHKDGLKTVVHVISNPYRVTQLYGFGTKGVNSEPKGLPFPTGLEFEIKSDVEAAIGGQKMPLELPVGLEGTKPSTTPFTACAPEGVTGNAKIHKRFVQREAASVSIKAVEGETCVIAHAHVGKKYIALQPPVRTCELPWNLVNLEVAGGLGITGKKANEEEEIIVNARSRSNTAAKKPDHSPPPRRRAKYRARSKGSRASARGTCSSAAGPAAKAGARRTRSCSSAASAKKRSRRLRPIARDS